MNCNHVYLSETTAIERACISAARLSTDSAAFQAFLPFGNGRGELLVARVLFILCDAANMIAHGKVTGNSSHSGCNFLTEVKAAAAY